MEFHVHSTLVQKGRVARTYENSFTINDIESENGHNTVLAMCLLCQWQSRLFH